MERHVARLVVAGVLGDVPTHPVGSLTEDQLGDVVDSVGSGHDPTLPGKTPATVRRVAHETSITVRFSDLDPYDHVNHARYLTYFESARIEMLDAVGYGMSRMKRDGFQIVLVEVCVRFQAAAGLHDRIAITTNLVDIKRASTSWAQEARVGDRVVATLEATAAFTDASGTTSSDPHPA